MSVRVGVFEEKVHARGQHSHLLWRLCHAVTQSYIIANVGVFTTAKISHGHLHVQQHLATYNPISMVADASTKEWGSGVR